MSGDRKKRRAAEPDNSLYLLKTAKRQLSNFFKREELEKREKI
jgi:hypothetical protein